MPEPQQVYSFPTRARCPRCGADDTVATSTQGGVQYRRCVRGQCRKTFKASGTQI